MVDRKRRASIDIDTGESIAKITALKKAIADLGNQSNFDRVKRGLAGINVDLEKLLKGTDGVEKKLNALGKVKVDGAIASIQKLRQGMEMLSAENADKLQTAIARMVEGINRNADNIKEIPVNSLLADLQELGAGGLAARQNIDETTASLRELSSVAQNLKSLENLRINTANFDPTKPQAFVKSLRDASGALTQLLNIKDVPVKGAIADFLKSFDTLAAGDRLANIREGIVNLSRVTDKLDPSKFGELRQEITELQRKIAALNPGDVEGITEAFNQLRGMAEKAKTAIAAPIDKSALDEVEAKLRNSYFSEYEERANTAIEGVNRALSSVRGEKMTQELQGIQRELSKAFEERDSSKIQASVDKASQFLTRLKAAGEIDFSDLDVLQGKIDSLSPPEPITVTGDIELNPEPAESTLSELEGRSPSVEGEVALDADDAQANADAVESSLESIDPDLGSASLDPTEAIASAEGIAASLDDVDPDVGSAKLNTDDARQAVENLKNGIESFEVADIDDDSLRKQVERLQGLLSDVDLGNIDPAALQAIANEVAEAKRQLQDLGETRTTLPVDSGRLDEVMEDLAKARQSIDSLINAADNAKGIFEEIDSEPIQQAIADIETAQAALENFDGPDGEIQAQVDNLAQSLKNLQAIAEQLDDGGLEIEGELGSLEVVLDTLQQEISTDSLDGVRDALRSLDEELNAVDGEQVEELRTAIARLTAEADELESVSLNGEPVTQDQVDRVDALTESTQALINQFRDPIAVETDLSDLDPLRSAIEGFPTDLGLSVDTSDGKTAIDDLRDDIQAGPDSGDWQIGIDDTEAQSARERLAEPIAPEVVPSVEVSDLRDELDSLGDEVSPDVTPRLNEQEARDGLDDLTEPLTPEIKPVVNEGSAQSELDQLGEPITPEVVPSVDIRDLQGELDSLGEEVSPDVTPQLNDRDAREGLDGLTETLTPEIAPKVNDGEAGSDLGQLGEPIAPEVTPSVDIAELRDELDSLGSEVSPDVTPQLNDQQTRDGLERLNDPISPVIAPSVDDGQARSDLDQLEETIAPEVIPSVDVGDLRNELDGLGEEVSPDVTPQLNDRATRDGLDELSETLTPEIAPTVNEDRAKPELDRLREPIEPEVIPMVDIGDLRGELDSLGDEVSPSVTPRLDDQNARDGLDDLVETLTPEIAPTVNDRQAQSELDQLGESITPEVIPSVDVGDLRGELDSLGDEVSPDVTPELNDQQAREGLGDLTETLLPEITPKVNDGQTQLELDQLGEPIAPEIVPSVEVESLRAELDSLGEQVSPDVTPQLNEQQARDGLERLDDPISPVIAPTVDDGRVRPELDQLEETITPQVVPSVDIGDLQNELDSLGNEVSPDVTPKLDDQDAREGLSDLAEALTPEITPEVDGGQAQSDLDGLAEPIAPAVTPEVEIGELRNELDRLGDEVSPDITPKLNDRRVQEGLERLEDPLSAEITPLVNDGQAQSDLGELESPIAPVITPEVEAEPADQALERLTERQSLPVEAELDTESAGEGVESLGSQIMAELERLANAEIAPSLDPSQVEATITDLQDEIKAGPGDDSWDLTLNTSGADEALRRTSESIENIPDGEATLDVDTTEAETELGDLKTTIADYVSNLKGKLENVNASGVFSDLIAELNTVEAELQGIDPGDADGLRRIQSQAQSVTDSLRGISEVEIQDLQIDIETAEAQARIDAVQGAIADLQAQLRAQGGGEGVQEVSEALLQLQARLSNVNPQNLDELGAIARGVDREFERLRRLNLDNESIAELTQQIDGSSEALRQFVDQDIDALVRQLQDIPGIDIYTEDAEAAIARLREQVGQLIDEGADLTTIREALERGANEITDEIQSPMDQDEQALEQNIVAGGGASLGELAENANAEKVGQTLNELASIDLGRLNGDLGQLREQFTKAGEAGDDTFIGLAEEIDDFQRRLRTIDPPDNIEAIAAEFKQLQKTIDDAMAIDQGAANAALAEFQARVNAIDPTNMEEVNQAIDELIAQAEGLNGVNSDKAEKELNELREAFERFNRGEIDATDLQAGLAGLELNARDTSEAMQRLAKDVEMVTERAAAPGKARDAANAAIAGLNEFGSKATEKLGGVFNAVNSISFKLFMVQMAFMQAQQAAMGFYQNTIGMTEQLNQQILSTQTSLVATQEIFKNGMPVEGMMESIEALRPAIESSLKNIREDSLELVGVTSEQLVPLFQILATNAGAIANQSKEWPDAIKAAEKLTIDFAAAMGTIGIPLHQARQEIQSILQGYIDQNSLLAKQTGITNQQISQWKQKGVLVDELHKRFGAFVEGNKLAARSITGILSNVTEVFQEIAREASEPFYEPMVAQLEKLYNWLKANREAIKDGVMGVYEFFGRLAEMLGAAIAKASESMKPLIDALGQNISDSFSLIGAIVEATTEKIAMMIKVVGQLTAIAAPILDFAAKIYDALDQIGGIDFAAQIIAVGLLSKAIFSVGAAALSASRGIAGLVATIMAGSSGATGAAIAFLKLDKAIAAVTGGYQAATGAIVATTAAMKGMNASMIVGTGLATGLKVAVGALGLLATPIAALAAGLTTVYLVGKNIQWEKFTEDHDFLIKKTDESTSRAYGLAMQLKKMREEFSGASSDGGAAITDAEAKRIEELGKQMQGQKIYMEEQIKSYQAIKDALKDDKQKTAIQALIDDLEKAAAVIDGSNIAVMLQKLADQGEAFKILGDEAVSAFQRIREGRYASMADAERDIGILKKNTQAQIEAGAITADEAIKRYKMIAENSRLSADVRIEAEKLVTAAMKQEGDRRLALIQREKAALEEAMADGTVSKEKAAIESAEIDAKLAEENLRGIRARIKERQEYELREGLAFNGQQSEAMKALNAELDQAETQLANARKQKRDAEKQEELASVDRQLALLDKSRKQLLINEDQYFQASNALKIERFDAEIKQLEGSLSKLAATDKAGREALLAQIAAAETKKAEVYRAAEEKLFNERIQRLKIAQQLLSLEYARASDTLEDLVKESEFYGRSLGETSKQLDLNRQELDLSTKALDQRQRLLQSLAEVEKSWQELQKAGLDIDLSRQQRALDYFRQLQDEKVKGTILERTLREEMQRLGISPYQDELKILQDIQDKQMESHNAKVAMIATEQALQREMLEMEIEKEKTQARQLLIQQQQNVLQAEQNKLAAEQESLKANQGRIQAEDTLSQAMTDEETKAQQLDELVRRGAPQVEIEAAQAELAQSQRQRERAQVGVANADRQAALAGRAVGMADQGVALAQEGLSMAQDEFIQADDYAARRRASLRNRQQAEAMRINEEGTQLQSQQRIEQGQLLSREQMEDTPQAVITDGPDGRRQAPRPSGGPRRIIQAPQTRREPATLTVSDAGTGFLPERDGSSLGDRRFTPSDGDRLTDSSSLSRPSQLPEDMGSPLAAIAGAVGGKLDTIISLLSSVEGKAGKGEMGSSTTIAPVINNQFQSAEDQDVWAKVSKQVLGVIDSVIPDFG